MNSSPSRISISAWSSKAGAKHELHLHESPIPYKRGHVRRLLGRARSVRVMIRRRARLASASSAPKNHRRCHSAHKLPLLMLSVTTLRRGVLGRRHREDSEWRTPPGSARRRGH